MDEADLQLMRSVSRYLEQVSTLARQEATDQLTGVGERISQHLGLDARTLPVVQENIPDHRLVDADLVLGQVQQACGGELFGIRGGDYRGGADTVELVANPHVRFIAGPVDYAERPTGPASTRQVVVCGVRLLHHAGQPLVVVQRAANPRFGRESASLEVLGEDPDLVSDLLAEIREQMVAVSVLRGQVVALTTSHFDGNSGVEFLHRPEVAADDVVLPPGVLDELAGHVLGIGAHREVLRGLGQHLKRGVLLYGPPGTGKTLTLRHLVARATGSTVILLRGSGLGMVGEAATLARTFQPSLVVLEDLDLVAMERDYTPQPLLFEVLDALDGLDGDADVAFLMTTNRVDVLEPALAQRPGRVDLALELGTPGPVEREQLIRLYSRALRFSDQAIAEAADRAAGATGAFVKELVRAAVLLAVSAGEQPADAHLTRALDSLLSSGRRLTRSMLGGEPVGSPPAPGPAEWGWVDSDD